MNKIDRAIQLLQSYKAGELLECVYFEGCDENVDITNADMLLWAIAFGKKIRIKK